MRKAEIADQNATLLRRQREFRLAADIVTDAWMGFAEVAAVAVVGSVAKALWKEVPRFREFRRAGIEVWHECGDLDMAFWLDHQDRLRDIRKTTDRTLQQAFANGAGMSVAGHQLDIFLFEPGSDRYLGRLCWFGTCPKGKRDCATPGCGDIPFNKVIPGFEPYVSLLAGVDQTMLYRRGEGRLRSALDLPSVSDTVA